MNFIVLGLFLLTGTSTWAQLNFTQQYRVASEAIFGMGVRLQTVMDDSSKNFVVSPLSSATVIAQLMLGAEGKFREQLYELLSLPKTTNTNYVVDTYGQDLNNETYSLAHFNLHLQLSSVLKVLEKKTSVGKHFVLNQKSGVFFNKQISLRRRFVKQLKMFYDADVYSVDFSSNPVENQRFINKWASHHTNGLIPKVLSTAPATTTSSLFLNAVYFLGEWETPFSNELNSNGTFFVGPNETVQTTYMMGNIEQILYVETEDYRIVVLPYKNDELGMYIILPNTKNTNRYNIKEFAKSLHTQDVLAAMSRAKPHDVIVKIPKLNLSNTISILKPLQKYTEFKENEEKEPTNKTTNVLVTLDNKIGDFKNFTATKHEDILLTTAAVNTTMQVSDIVQEMVFSINEKGTEAAAVTASILDYIASSKTFVIDHPFVFFIQHEVTSATLFWGTISDPTQH